MPTVIDGGTRRPQPATDHDADDPFIRVGEVFDFRRSHLPSVEFTEVAEQLTLDHCHTLRQADIQQFRTVRTPRWADYNEIAAAYQEQLAAGSQSHNRPFPRERAFAPVNLVVAEAYPPIRATMVFHPIYPGRAKVGTFIPGQRLWLAYAAVAVLNSERGRCEYEHWYRELEKKEPARDNISAKALRKIPVANKEYRREQLYAVAHLACQLSGLYEAEHECRTKFPTQIEHTKQLLWHQVGNLLGPREEQIDVGALTNGPTPLPFDVSEGVPLPKLPPVQLLATEQRDRLDFLRHAKGTFGADAGEFQHLKLLAFWEDAVNNGLPGELIFERGSRAA